MALAARGRTTYRYRQHRRRVPMAMRRRHGPCPERALTFHDIMIMHDHDISMHAAAAAVHWHAAADCMRAQRKLIRARARARPRRRRPIGPSLRAILRSPWQLQWRRLARALRGRACWLKCPHVHARRCHGANAHTSTRRRNNALPEAPRVLPPHLPRTRPPATRWPATAAASSSPPPHPPPRRRMRRTAPCTSRGPRPAAPPARAWPGAA